MRVGDPDRPHGNGPDKHRLTRRAVLSRGAALSALGIAASALREGAADATTGLVAMTAYNVRNFGAAGDGVSNDQPAIQSAVDSAAAAGGGLVFFPRGTYALGSSVVLESAVHLLGSGVGATSLILKSGVNAPVLISDASAGTIFSFSIRELTVDGNKIQNSFGAGIQLDANDWIIDSVVVRNCAGDGITSTSSNDNAGPDSMEAILTRTKVHDNLGNGITWSGPHDSFWSQLLVFYNGPSANSVDGVRITGNGFALFVDQMHVYGGHHEYGLHVMTDNSTFHNCQVEGASRANVYLEANDARYIGGTVFSGGLANAVAFKIGNAAHSYVAGLRLETAVTDCSGGVFTSFLYGPFNSIIDILYYNSDGSPAFPDGLAFPARSYVNVVPGTASLPTPAQTQFPGWLALREPDVYPTVNPAGGGILYVQAGALKYRGENGTITTIAPA